MLITTISCFTIFHIWEKFNPGWYLPKIRSWPIRVLLINAIQIFVVIIAGKSWEIWFSQYSIFSLQHHVDIITGAFIAYLFATFIFYWWHRLRHESDILWRCLHQIHHSPQRIETITSFYKHPLEMIINSIISSFLVFTVLGLSPVSGGIYTFLTALGEFIYHANVRTPHWLGYIFQRPEMHRIHHERDYHKNNYGDLVIWDMLFGTYENPKEWNNTCGFSANKEEKLFDMLMLRDINSKTKINFQNLNILKKIITLLLCLNIGVANACSVFRGRNINKDIVIAKNFDWFNGEGIIVINPKGKKRVSLNSKKTWVSKFKSISFTTAGPGLPVSGMNEKGIVVEALLDLSSKVQRNDNDLIGLEWSQYILDNFSNLEDIMSFTAAHGFNQMLIPLHFFVCESSGKCAVFENRPGYEKQVKITTGEDLKIPVLANNDWRDDYDISKLGHIKRFFATIIPYTSKNRFSKLANNNFINNPKNNSEIFEQLHEARIPNINKWQIIWNPAKLSVTWKVPEKNIINSIDMNEFSGECNNSDLVLDINSPSKPWNFGQEDLNNVKKRVFELAKKTKKSNKRYYVDLISNYTLNTSCKLKYN